MKSLGNIVLVLMMNVILLGSAWALETREEVDIPTLSKSFNESVDQRDFHKAREVLSQMIPIMKEDIKATKKFLHHLVKEDNVEFDPEAYKKILDRKHELVESIETVLKSSPAAIRVKSQDLKVQIEEYKTMLQES